MRWPRTQNEKKSSSEKGQIFISDPKLVNGKQLFKITERQKKKTVSKTVNKIIMSKIGNKLDKTVI